jgi:hypothetical protein
MLCHVNWYIVTDVSEECSATETLVSVYMVLHPRWREYSCTIAITTATAAMFSHCNLPMHSDDVIKFVVVVLLYSNKSCYNGDQRNWSLNQSEVLPDMGPRQQGPHSTLPRNYIYSSHIACSVCLLCISQLEIQMDIKIVGRSVISHLSKYTVTLFILVPSSYVKLLFHSTSNCRI